MENLVRFQDTLHVFLMVGLRLFDVGKQVVGQMFVRIVRTILLINSNLDQQIHGTNVLASDVASHHSTSNACVYYFLNILLDTTFGSSVCHLTLSTEAI